MDFINQNKQAFNDNSSIKSSDSIRESLDIKLSNVNYVYPNQKLASIAGINLDIPHGSTLAIVGKSGSGKTTLVDLILGLLTPTSGSVSIGNLNPKEFIKNYPGLIGYVPQEVGFLDGTIAENILLTDGAAEESDLIDALKRSSLGEFAFSGPEGLEYEVGENGNRLSGGQRQRLGIARALFTNPQIVILDEATSALDASTEIAISNTIENLRGGVTLVVIAHRLSTVTKADNVIYLHDGEIEAAGTFEEVRRKVPNFDSQAKLLGL